MKLSTLKRVCVMFTVNHILCGTRFFGAKRHLLRWIGYEIGANTKIVAPLFCTAALRIGADCWIGRGLTVHGNGTVEIGDRCDIAPDVTFLTGGHEIGGAGRRAGRGEKYHITVGSGTWIGARSTILGDTRIGQGCVVAACACVTKHTADHLLVGGVPAVTIRELEHASSRVFEEQNN